MITVHGPRSTVHGPRSTAHGGYTSIMNYDLAIMALEGLGRSPLKVEAEGSTVTIEAEADAFKHLARLCLLLGGEMAGAKDEFDLQPDVHVAGKALRLRRR